MDMKILQEMPVANQAIVFSKRVGDKALTGSIISLLGGEVKNELGQKILPKSAIMMDKTDFDSMSYKVSYLWEGKFDSEALLGYQNFEGQEPSLKSRSCSAYYNTEALPVPLSSKWSPGSRLETEFYKLATKSEDKLATFFAEQDDLDFHQALVNGFSENISDSTAWNRAGVSEASPGKIMHPNIFVNSNTTGGSFVDWSSTYDTASENINTAADAGVVGDAFGTLALDKVMQLGRTYCKTATNVPGSKASRILVISSHQWFQLKTEDGLFFKRFSAGAIDAAKNPNIQGHIFEYEDYLIIVNPRSPVYQIESSVGAGAGFVFSRPSTDNNTVRSTSKVTREVKGSAGSNVGTMEVAYVLGAEALINLQTKEGLVLEPKTFNYNTLKGLLGIRLNGMNRYEGRASGQTPINESSMLFLTPTTSLIV